MTAPSCSNNLPGDLETLRPWLNLARRMQRAAQEGGSRRALLSVQVVLDEHGNPAGWLEPSVRRFEPKSSDDLLRLLGSVE